MARKSTRKTTATAAKVTAQPVAETSTVKLPSDVYSYGTLIETTKTKSAMIRLLSSEGYARADISRFMNIRYQHVRNVLVQDTQKAEALANQKK